MKELLKNVYELSPYKKGVKNTTSFDEEKVGSPVYGEITQRGTEALLEKFSEYFNKNTVFYDLGSGLGKMVAHVGLVSESKSIGIEYSEQRHSGATIMQETFLKNHNNISFKNGNVLDFDLSDATVIYMDNTVFPDNISLEIYKKVNVGCLMLYKKKIKGLEEEQNYQNDLVERTYHQRGLYWMTKSCNL
jgi:hypothetical protein